MKKLVSARGVAPALGVLLVVAGLAEAKMTKERANIVSTDWKKMQMELKSPKGRVKTWNVARDCAVRFTDKKAEFPNPKLSDLRPPMYIHFEALEGTDIIQNIEVIEVGFEPSQGGPGVRQNGVVTNLDMSKGHLELNLGAGPQTFLVDPKAQLVGLKRGDRVSVLIERRGTQEVVTKVGPQP